jgi:hypothetical protein
MLRFRSSTSTTYQRSSLGSRLPSPLECIVARHLPPCLTRNIRSHGHSSRPRRRRHLENPERRVPALPAIRRLPPLPLHHTNSRIPQQSPRFTTPHRHPTIHIRSLPNKNPHLTSHSHSTTSSPPPRYLHVIPCQRITLPRSVPSVVCSRTMSTPVVPLFRSTPPSSMTGAAVLPPHPPPPPPHLT